MDFQFERLLSDATLADLTVVLFVVAGVILAVGWLVWEVLRFLDD